MSIVASTKSAAIAGTWSAFGFVPFDAWLEHHQIGSALAHNVALLGVALVFLFVPGYFLVIGRDNEPFSRTWLFDAEECARYGAIAKRMIVWFVSAAVTGLIWSPVFGRLYWKASAA
jgi:hypothetical protein